MSNMKEKDSWKPSYTVLTTNQSGLDLVVVYIGFDGNHPITTGMEFNWPSPEKEGKHEIRHNLPGIGKFMSKAEFCKWIGVKSFPNFNQRGNKALMNTVHGDIAMFSFGDNRQNLYAAIKNGICDKTCRIHPKQIEELVELKVA